MGEFLVILPATGKQEKARQGFQRAITATQQLKALAPARTLEEDWFCAASFPRRNHSGHPVVVDMETGNWLLACGSWFHRQGFGSGEESRLLKRLLQVGPQELGGELEGFFVIVYGTAQTREVSVITDLVCSCHCYQRETVWGTAIASSPFMLAPLADVSLDCVALQEFLYTGVIYEDRTYFNEIRKLRPARVSTFTKGRMTQQARYWCFENIEPGSLGDEAAVTGLGDALCNAASRIGDMFSNPVCDLTGGYDSRATICGFLGAGVPFSSAVSGNDDDPDVRISKGLSELIHVPNLHSLPSGNLTFARIKEALPYTDGEYELAEYYRILSIHRALSKQFDVSINGSFGEIGRGYWWELLFPRASSCTTLDAEKIARLRYAASAHDSSVFAQDRRLDLVRHFADVIQRTNQPVSHLPNTAQMDHAYLMMRMQCWQGRIASSTQRLWPCLSPFLFRSVLEPMLASSVPLRRNGLLIRKMLQRLQPAVAAFPLEHGHPAVPVTLFNFYRFFPLLGHYRKRVLDKISRKLGSANKQAAATPNQRLQLWQEEEVRERLAPQAMHLGAIADPQALQRFMENAQQQHFSFDAQFLRTLTVEYTLASLKDAGIHIG